MTTTNMFLNFGGKWHSPPKALKDYITPTNQKGLRAFLAFLGTPVTTGSFSLNFLSGRAHYSMPSRKVPPVPLHGINMCAPFKHLISVLCHEHTLTLHRNNDKLELHTDASTMGIRAVLSVVREDMERPVAYYSKGLSAAEKNYAVSELECLAVVKAIDHFAIH